MELALQLIEEAKQQRALHLDLGNCGLTELPDELFELTWLESLILGGTYIDLDTNHYRATTNDSKRNQISNLPKKIKKLNALKQFSIGNLSGESHEKINGIRNLSECKSLTHLNILNHDLNETRFFESLKNLQHLDLDKTSIIDISHLRNLKHLQRLDLSRTGIKNIYFLSRVISLEVLIINNTQISDISPIENLKNLKALIIGKTQVSDISPIHSLKNLQKLDFSETQVSDISPISNLTKLQELVISATQVNDISPISRLIKLQDLDLSATQVSNISPISRLINLEKLDLAATQISDITPLLLLLKKPLQAKVIEHTFFHDQFINLYKTPIPNIVYDLLGDKSNEKLINYLEQIAQPDNPPQKLYEAKLMVVGEPGAGKTSLMNKLLDPNYMLPEPCDTDSTTGINIESWPFKIPNKNQTFQAHIWDFGGQKRQYMTHQFFLTAHTVYVLVASNDRKEQNNFPYWFKIINLLGRDNSSNRCSPLIIFLNERENKQNAPVFSFNFDGKLYEQQYPDLQFDDKRFDLKYPIELQAFTHKIQQSLLKLHHIGDPVPAQWISVRKQLSQLAETKPYISLKEFQTLCCKHGINNEGYQQVFSYRLHTLGSILHFQDDDILRELIIIDPNWAVDAVYSVLKDGRIESRGGYFSRTDLKQIWGNDYSTSEQAHLLRLMSYEAFEICYPIDHPEEDGEWYLAPQFLTDNSADYSLESEQNPLKFRFSYTFMPEGIVARLIVRLHENVLTKDNQPLAWKTGFILQNNGAQLRVQEREQDGLKVLDMEAGGRADEQKYIIRKVRDEVSRIHRRWFKGIQVNQMVPCACSDCQNSNEPHYFKNDVLQRYLEKGRIHIDCEKSIESVAIRGLLEGIYQQDELPPVEADTKGTSEKPSPSVVNNISVTDGAQLVMPQAETSQPIIQANKNTQVETIGQVNEQTDSKANPTTPEPVRTLMPSSSKKSLYQQWWVISLALGIVVGGAVGLWLSSFGLGLLAGGAAFAAMMFFQPGKTYVRAAWLCMMAVISNPLLSGMVGQNPELKDGQLGFIFKFNESLPTIVLLGLLVLTGILFILNYMDKRRS